MSCTDKNNPNRQATSITGLGTTFTIFFDQGPAEFPPLTAFQGADQCDESCDQSIGACCRGANCIQKSGCRCSPEVFGGAFVGNNIPCEPNPCCPTCEQYVEAFDEVAQAFDFEGTCCRGSYINDGHGACCPPGQECCGPVVGNDAGADNGACCSAEKPYCCRELAFSGSSRFFSRQCQQYPPAELGQVGVANACIDPSRVLVFSLPSEPCTLQFDAQPTQLILGAGPYVYSSGYTVRLEVGDLDRTYVVPLLQRPQIGGGQVDVFCKPPGIVEAKVTISDVQIASQYGYQECFTTASNQSFSAWNVGLRVTKPCDCNPLP